MFSNRQMKNLISASTAAITAFCIVACGRGDRGRVSRTTVGDTLFVMNAPKEDLSPLFSFELDLTIGVGASDQEGEDNPYRLQSISDIAVDAEGRIIISNTSQREVRVFDSNGEFLYRFGEEGEGTGQFHGYLPVMPVTVLSDGSIAVQDYPHSVEVFSLSGEPRYSIELSELAVAVRVPGEPTYPIRYMTFEDRLVIPWLETAPTGEQTCRFLITDELFSYQEWFPMAPSENRLYREGGTMAFVPFYPRYTWTITGGRILVLAKSDEYRLYYCDVMEDRWLQASLGVEPDSLSSEEIEAFKKGRLAGYPPEMQDRVERMAPFYDRIPFPALKSFFSGLMGDDRGRVWVDRRIETFPRSDPINYIYDLFDSEGVWLGFVESPRRLEFVRGDYAYAIAWDEYPKIERYRLIPQY